jgi:hypothetical protein
VVCSGSLIAPWAGIKKIVASLAVFPEKSTLFLQARSVTKPEFLPNADSEKLGSKLILSQIPLSTEDYDSLVSEADVGIAWYESEIENIHHVGFSSGKVAHYLSWGVPIIINRLPLLDKVVQTYKCGIVIDDIEEIGRGLETIRADYETYVAGAKKAYRELFDMDKYASDLVECIEAAVRAEKGGEGARW